MDAYVLARVIHVLAVVHWIGGVAMVTLVLLPSIGRLARPEDRLATFEAVEHRFSGQARLSTAAAGLSGLWMLWQTEGWWRLADPAQAWVTLMLAVWAVFTLVLFVAEPLVLHAWFHRAAQRDPEGTFRLVLRLHRVLLAVSVLAVAGGVAGAHGGL